MGELQSKAQRCLSAEITWVIDVERDDRDPQEIVTKGPDNL